jgi:hypothetical protein
LAYDFFKVADNGAIEKEGLIRVILQAGCPPRETAERILARMTEFNLPQKQTDASGVESYSRTAQGILRISKHRADLN